MSLDLIKGTDAKTAAVNVRNILKHSFKGIKFSVTTSRGAGCSSIDIRWTDGPTQAEVEHLTNRFINGRFDGMRDLYEYDRTFDNSYGSVKYIFLRREYTDALIQQTIQALVLKYGDYSTPTLADYRSGRAQDTTPVGNADGARHWSWSALIYRQIENAE